MSLKLDDTAGIASGAVFDCMDGWRDLIAKAASEVAELPEEWNARIVGGKLEDGGLFLDIWYDGWSPHIAIEAFTDDFREMSLTICEVCGRRGRLRLIGVAATRCDDHA